MIKMNESIKYSLMLNVTVEVGLITYSHDVSDYLSDLLIYWREIQ